MRILLSLSPMVPALLSFSVSPQLQNLVVSVILAVVVYFTGGASPKRSKHRDDYDSN